VFGSVLFLFATTTAFANTEPSAELFASNNTHEISVQSAYARLTGPSQSDLKYSILQVLKKYNIKAGRSGSILGAYQMSTDKDMTADNTEYVYVTPSKQICFIAKALAISLHQDSVAVFIPDNTAIGDVAVNFGSHPLSIDEAIHLVSNKLPALYSQGFSLHLTHLNNDFNHEKVSEIEWLGSKIDINEIKQAFPNEKIRARDGTAYLVYEDGRKETL
jgi:hypothetical protein